MITVIAVIALARRYIEARIMLTPDWNGWAIRDLASCGQSLIKLPIRPVLDKRIHPDLRFVLPDFLQQRISQRAARQELRLSSSLTGAVPQMLIQCLIRLFEKLVHVG